MTYETRNNAPELIGACAFAAHPAEVIGHPNVDQAERCTCLCHTWRPPLYGGTRPSRPDPMIIDQRTPKPGRRDVDLLDQRHRADPFDPPLHRSPDENVGRALYIVVGVLTAAVVAFVLIVVGALTVRLVQAILT